MICNYLKYIFKAKGRHGTHSPFVYAFVEQVLREQKTESQTFKKLSKREQILFRLIPFLKTEVVYLLAKESTTIKIIIHNTFPEIKIIELVDIKEIRTYQNALLILNLENTVYENLCSLETISNQSNFSIFVNSIHTNKQQFAIWEQLKSLKRFTLSLDFWLGGFLIQDKAFKVKQHFILK